MFENHLLRYDSFVPKITELKYTLTLTSYNSFLEPLVKINNKILRILQNKPPTNPNCGFVQKIQYPADSSFAWL